MDFIDSIMNTIGTILFIFLGLAVLGLVLMIKGNHAAKVQHSAIASNLSSRKTDFFADRQYVDVFGKCGISINSDRTKILRVL
jgi:uncharacterized metal-binding protein